MSKGKRGNKTNDGDTPNIIDRRTALIHMSALFAAGLLPAGAEAADSSVVISSSKKGVRKIATEEAFMIPEIAEEVRRLVRKGGTNLDLKLLAKIYDAPPLTPEQMQAPVDVTNRDALARFLAPKLLDIGEGRISEMDANGVDMHLLSISIPGVQMYESKTAVTMMQLVNDRLSEAVRRYPKRFAGLATFAPQDPAASVKEMERAINTLKLNGFLINSHTDNAYLDEQRFYPILEAAEALDVPIYIHPRAPSDGMAAPFRDYRLEGSLWGYGVEAATHALRLMLSGALDRFPRLKIVLGHMGEALPFWMWRLDFMGAPGGRAGLLNKLKPSEYLKRNFAITTSGVEDPLVLRFVIDKLGIDNVMWAIDYPYQPTAPAVAFIDTAPLSDEEREKIAHRNAERVFKIKT